MAFIVSLQGGMASGKTTLAQSLATIDAELHVSFEDNSNVIRELKGLNLNKNVFDDYIKIQRMFINEEIKRYNRLKSFSKVLIDLGPDEIEFYTLNYPKTLGQNWDVESALHSELKDLRKCKMDKIIFLNANIATLNKQKKNDSTRRRGFFDYYINNLHELKIEWFRGKQNVEFIDINYKDQEAIVSEALTILNRIR